MCNFMSAIVLKGKNVLAPMYNQSHSRMIEKLELEDDVFNARKVFVRAELRPHNDDLLSDVDKWDFVVDQDVVPDWYEDDPGKYEESIRADVKDWVSKNIVEICGQPCTKLKEENGNTYYHTCLPIFDYAFGSTNNYTKSAVRDYLLGCDFVKKLQKKYGDALVPVTMNLTSLDGLKDYGTITDIIGIPDLELYRECRENIFVGKRPWWLCTPKSTPSGYGASGVQYVDSDGYVNWDDCVWNGSVRPFFILKSNIVVS